MYKYGWCCEGMTDSTDLCKSISWRYTTADETSFGAKLANCKAAVSCEDEAIFVVKGEYKIKTIDIRAPGHCTYEIYYTLFDPDTVFAARDWPLDSEVGAGTSADAKGQFYIEFDSSFSLFLNLRMYKNKTAFNLFSFNVIKVFHEKSRF